MATRFYFDPTNTPSISPSFDASFEQNATAVRRKLIYKNTASSLIALANSAAFTIPITTTQDCLGVQFVSDPLPAQRINASNLFTFVMGVLESALTANATLAVVVRIVDSAGTARGTLFSVYGTGLEYAVSRETRIVSASALTALTILSGDRLVVEVGVRATAPSAATTFTLRLGFNAATDFALTAALTTDLNPWCEFSENLFPTVPNNSQNVNVGSGMSASERGGGF